MLEDVKARRRDRLIAGAPSVRSLALCAVVAIGLSIPGVSGASPSPSATAGPRGGPALGMSEDIQYLSGTALSARLDRYVEIGVKVSRFQLIWAAIQPEGPASYNWSSVDAVIAGLTARGIEPLPVIDATPAWARPRDCTTVETCAPADAGQYATFAAAAAARYSLRGVHDWEIWNEPNNPLFWKPQPSPATYAGLLKAAYPAIHAVDAAATVITGGLAPTDTELGWIAPVEFLADIYAAGAHASFDAVGWHPYDYPAVIGHHWDQMSRTEPSARSLMLAHGDGAKRIWATEFGAPTCTGDPSCVPEEQQSQILSRAYDVWSSYAWSGPLIVYSYQDRGTDETNREDYFGLVRQDGTAKPALATFASLTASR
jgi:hypothetical protein